MNSVINSKIAASLKHHCYESYEQAADIPKDALLQTTKADNVTEYQIYSSRNVLIILKSASGLLMIILAPYVLAISLAIYLHGWYYSVGEICSSSLVYSFLLLSALVCLYQYSFSEWGTKLLPGLYYKDNDRMISIVKGSLSLSCPSVIRGTLAELDACGNVNEVHATPWLFGGDIRTLLPFLTFGSNHAKYVRHWVRVPLNDFKAKNNELSGNGASNFEAVALDWFEAANTNDNAPVKALLILAGLTGGSQEGYILDLVYTASRLNWHCFVMVGRGLADTPMHSTALFNGARITDLNEATKVVRAAIGDSAHLFAIGISMGGIIIKNALVKSDLSEFIDGAVSVAGCFDTRKNINFKHSRYFWQPLLAFGLKQAFISPLYYWRLLKYSVFKESDVVEIADRIRDVYDFDSIMVAGIHGFNSVLEYYEAMCATNDVLESKIIRSEKNPGSFPRPLLVLHAVDDPIIHVDTIPTDPCDPHKPLLFDNLVVLITTVGGHVGWPIGLLPWKSKFIFMNKISLDFFESIIQLKIKAQ